jgi:hypothetical protein
MEAPEDTTVAAFAVAAAAVPPTPINTVLLPALMTRYWFPPSVVDTACTGVAALVLAVNVTVLPDGVKGALTITCPDFQFTNRCEKTISNTANASYHSAFKQPTAKAN